MTEKGRLSWRLFYVRNRESNLNFLVDADAALSSIPQNKTEPGPEISPATLQALNETKIAKAQASTMMYPNSPSPPALMLNASDKAVGCTLNQLIKNA